MNRTAWRLHWRRWWMQMQLRQVQNQQKDLPSAYVDRLCGPGMPLGTMFCCVPYWLWDRGVNKTLKNSKSLPVSLRFSAFSQIQPEAAPPAPQRPDGQAPVVKKTSTLQSCQAYSEWVSTSYPHLKAIEQKILSAAKCLCDVQAANYMLSHKQKLLVTLLLDGEHWRAHHRQIFHYEDGAWVMRSQLVDDFWDALMALEGLFVKTAICAEDTNTTVKWTWSEASNLILQNFNDATRKDDAVQFLSAIAKDNSDHLRATTSNKSWRASWLRRVADMVAQFRKGWESTGMPSVLSKLFLEECDSAMPVSRGFCFADVYLNDKWEVAEKRPSNDCYFKVDYPYFFETSFADDLDPTICQSRSKLRTFLESLYYQNEHAFQIKLCFICAAFHRSCTGKMLFQIGRGGDGKGMEAVLDAALFGSDARATLDCGVFMERAEFRKSAELAWNKANVRIQEMDQSGRFLADIWKRFVVDEEIDCRVNYGFTTKRRFGNSMKVQELNYENIPIIEECKDHNKTCEQLQRRVVCIRMGKGTFTPEEAKIDHANGIYKLIPQDELAAFLKHPLTASLYICGNGAYLSSVRIPWRIVYLCFTTCNLSAQNWKMIQLGWLLVSLETMCLILIRRRPCMRPARRSLNWFMARHRTALLWKSTSFRRLMIFRAALALAEDAAPKSKRSWLQWTHPHQNSFSKLNPVHGRSCW